MIIRLKTEKKMLSPYGAQTEMELGFFTLWVNIKITRLIINQK